MNIPRAFLNYVSDEPAFEKELEEALEAFYDENRERIYEMFIEAEETQQDWHIDDYVVEMIDEEFGPELDEILRDTLWENLDETAAIDLIMNIVASEEFPRSFSRFEMPMLIAELYKEEE